MRFAAVVGVLSLLTPALVAPGGGALELPLRLGPPPAAHAVPDLTAYRDNVDRMVQYALRFQRPDGGIYEDAFFLKDAEASSALVLLARAQNVDARGPHLGGLLRYFEAGQNPDGSWGRGLVTPTVTSTVLRGLLAAGYDPASLSVQRAKAYTLLHQEASDGSWSDGGAHAVHQTAANVANLLRLGLPRDDLRIQRAMSFILATQDAASGGFPPTPGWFTTAVVTAEAVSALDGYLLAPGPAGALAGEAKVRTAADRAVAYLASDLDPTTGKWQHSIGANAAIVGPAAHFYGVRGLPIPAWLLRGARALVEHQAPDGGLLNDARQVELLGWTLEAGAGLTEVRRAFGSAGTVAVQVTRNDRGVFGEDAVRLDLVDAANVSRAGVEGNAGFLALSWSGLAPGAYVLRATAAGAASSEEPFFLL